MHTLPFLLTTILLTAAPDPTGEPQFQHPLVKDHGGIVVLPDTAEQPKKDSKVLLDLTSDETRGEVLKGLDRAAVIANLYAQAGVGPKQGMQLAVVLHGPATKAALNDDAFAQHAEDSSQGHNPHRRLIRDLKEAGVEIYVCGQALARQKYRSDQVAPEVTIAISAATVHINKQMAGYVLVP